MEGFHWCEVTLKMMLLNLGRPIKVEPLNEAVAIELGAELLGELIVFSVAAAGLIFETKRYVEGNLNDKILYYLWNNFI